MWVLHAYDMDSHEEFHWLEGDLSWKNTLDQAKLLVGHNLLGYDRYVLKRLFGYILPDDCVCHDTLIMSLVLDYRRFNKLGHSLENWGEALGELKMDWLGHLIEIGFLPPGSKKKDAFARWHPDMLIYVKQDVHVTKRVYAVVLQEFKALYGRVPAIKSYMQAEHAVAEWCSEARLHGWPFDIEGARLLIVKLEEVMNRAYEALNAELGYKCVAVDLKNGVYEVKQVKYTKFGTYYATVANWFGVDPYSGVDDPELNGEIGHRQIQGDYCRVEFPKLSLDSIADVKIFLYRNGWKPTQWNYKFEGRVRVQTSPKITEDSLECLGGNGKLYNDFLVARSRWSIVKTWIENTDENGMLHGDCMTIGTPSMRLRHSIIVNVPSGEINKDGTSVSEWGPEMRALFGVLPGWKQVGCDSAGNQVRGLAHYLKDDDFTELLINGDVHSRNATEISKILSSMGIKHEVPRPRAKRILYAFLFGAGGPKLWSYIFDVFDDVKGPKFKEGFIDAVPGLPDLLDKLAKVFRTTKKKGFGYIPGIAGNRIYVDSLHKLLVYLLQACEKATCSSAIMYQMEKFKEEKIPYIPLIFMHDESQVMVPDAYAERAREIGIEAFREGPKRLGITIMDGDGKIGMNWRECH